MADPRASGLFLPGKRSAAIDSVNTWSRVTVPGHLSGMLSRHSPKLLL